METWSYKVIDIMFAFHLDKMLEYLIIMWIKFLRRKHFCSLTFEPQLIITMDM